MAYTSKDFNRDVDKSIASALKGGVPPQAIFLKLMLSGQEMGNYHIQQARQKMIDEQDATINLGKIDGLKKN